MALLSFSSKKGILGAGFPIDVIRADSCLLNWGMFGAPAYPWLEEWGLDSQLFHGCVIFPVYQFR